MNTITCTCSAPIGIRHSVYCPVFEHEIRRDEELGLLPPSRPVIRDESGKLVIEPREVLAPLRTLRGRLIFPGLPPFEMPTFDTECKVVNEEHDKPRRFMSLSVEMKLTDKSRESLRRFARQLMGQERPPLVDVVPSWETDEYGDDREVWHGRMRIVRNRKRMRKLKRRGVMFMDLRPKTGNKHPDGYEGPRAWAWFTQDLHSEVAHRELLESITDDDFDDVPAGTTGET